MKTINFSKETRDLEAQVRLFRECLFNLEAELNDARDSEAQAIVDQIVADGLTVKNIMRLDARILEDNFVIPLFRTLQADIRKMVHGYSGVRLGPPKRLHYLKCADKQYQVAVLFNNDEELLNQLGILNFVPYIRKTEENYRVIRVIHDDEHTREIYHDILIDEDDEVYLRTTCGDNETMRPFGDKLINCLVYVHRNIDSRKRYADAQKDEDFLDTLYATPLDAAGPLDTCLCGEDDCPDCKPDYSNKPAFDDADTQCHCRTVSAKEVERQLDEQAAQCCGSCDCCEESVNVCSRSEAREIPIVGEKAMREYISALKEDSEYAKRLNAELAKVRPPTPESLGICGTAPKPEPVAVNS